MEEARLTTATDWGWRTFSVKNQTVSVFSLVGNLASVTAPQHCPCGGRSSHLSKYHMLVPVFKQSLSQAPVAEAGQCTFRIPGAPLGGSTETRTQAHPQQDENGHWRSQKQPECPPAINCGVSINGEIYNSERDQRATAGCISPHEVEKRGLMQKQCRFHFHKVETRSK